MLIISWGILSYTSLRWSI